MVTILRVQDHGMWRGQRTWTVYIDDNGQRAQVSAAGMETESEAREDALATWSNRRPMTKEDRAALSEQARTLNRTILGGE